MVTLTEQAQIDFNNSKEKGLHPDDKLIQLLITKGFKDIKEYQDSWYEEWCKEYDRKHNK